MKKDDDFTFFFLWLTPAEEGSQARSHKIRLTEVIRLELWRMAKFLITPIPRIAPILVFEKKMCYAKIALVGLY